MTVQFCAAPNCHEPAIGVSRWDRQEQPVSIYCRADYLATVETVRCEVVGSMRVTDCRTLKGVAKGGVVEVDPLETNVAQLVYAGHVKVLPAVVAKPAAAPAAEAKTKG